MKWDIASVLITILSSVAVTIAALEMPTVAIISCTLLLWLALLEITETFPNVVGLVWDLLCILSLRMRRNFALKVLKVILFTFNLYSTYPLGMMTPARIDLNQRNLGNPYIYSGSSLHRCIEFIKKIMTCV
jgi:hypothetical protein